MSLGNIDAYDWHQAYKSAWADNERLRAALAEAEKKLAVLEDSESCEAITLRTRLAEAENEISRLRAALAKDSLVSSQQYEDEGNDRRQRG